MQWTIRDGDGPDKIINACYPISMDLTTKQWYVGEMCIKEYLFDTKADAKAECDKRNQEQKEKGDD